RRQRGLPRHEAPAHGTRHRRPAADGCRSRDPPGRTRIMSGAGSPEVDVDGTGLRVVIVAGSWHDEITNGLIAGATRTLEASGARFELVRVPGSFELPVVSKAALEAGADAVVALGVIIRGGTPHFEYVSAAATDGLTRAALDTGKAGGIGGRHL